MFITRGISKLAKAIRASVTVIIIINAKRIRVKRTFGENGLKHYQLFGLLFLELIAFDVNSTEDSINKTSLYKP